MIFLDTNYFLRCVVVAESAQSKRLSALAALTFRAIENGSLTATTNEVVLHEVAYLLEAKSHYGFPAERVAAQLEVILRLPGMRLALATRKRCLRALEIWSQHPSLGFADSLIVATLEETGVELATFDSRFDRFPTLARWMPENLARA
jgi:predicted nucleic acid-binding protein